MVFHIADGVPGIAKEKPQAEEGANQPRFCQHIEVHIVGVEDDDARFLDQFVVNGIDVFKSPPADAEQRVIEEHGNGCLPHIHAHGNGRIGFTVAEDRQESMSYAAVIKGADQRRCQKEEPHPFIPKEAEEKDQCPDAEPGAAGIGQHQAEGQDGKEYQIQDPVPVMAGADHHRRRSAHDDQQEGRQ